jgi:hypothetical protein
MKLTVNDRVAMFLYEYRHIEADYEVPGEVTQAGIASGVGISVTHVPRAVGKLIDQGYVFSKSSYVKGSKRKKKTYHLNRDGIIKYRELRDSLGKQSVNVGDGQSTLNDLFQRLKDTSQERNLPASTFFEVLISVTDDDGFDEDSYWKDRDSVTEVPTSTMPFFGREEMCRTILEMAQGQSAVVLVVYGEEGIGKTALVRESMAHAGQPAVFCSDLEAEKDRLIKALDQMGSNGTGATPPLFVLDLNIGEEPGEELKGILKRMVVDLGLTVLVTATPLGGSRLHKQMAGIDFKKIEVGPLDKESVRALAGEDMDEKELESLIHLSKGNPRKILAALDVEIDEEEELETHQKALLRLLKSDQ